MLILIKKYLNYILVISSSIITLYLSSLFYNYKLDKINKEYNDYVVITETNQQKLKISLLEQNEKFNKENEELNLKLRDVENEKYKLLKNIDDINNDIKRNISNGTDRLYINAKCERTNSSERETKNNSTSKLDDGKTSKAIIDERDAESIIEITSKADHYKLQLEGLQSWVEEILKRY